MPRLPGGIMTRLQAQALSAGGLPGDPGREADALRAVGTAS